MKIPPLLEEALRTQAPIAGMFLTPEYFYMKRPKMRPGIVRQRFDKETQEWVDMDPDRLKTDDYRRICLQLYNHYEVRINDIAVFVKLTVAAANGHASGAGSIGYARKAA
jgi:hypothetical protein